VYLVKALLTLILSHSYPHFLAFGTEMATLFSENKVAILLKYRIKIFAGLGFY